MEIYAHRGFSGRQPEATRAAYLEAIDWAERSGVPLWLECDVHFSGDDQLVCLHDLTLDRTSDALGPALDRTVAELTGVDFGSWRTPGPTPDQRRLVTLAELLDLVADARSRGVDVGVAIETKHPNPRALAVEERVAQMVVGRGWHRRGAPVRVMSFSLPALTAARGLLPEVPRTLLLEHDLGRWRDGRLPPGIGVVGPDLTLLRADPGFVARARAQGNAVHPWTVNRPEDLDFCLDLEVGGLITDYPDRAVGAIGRRGLALRPLASTR